MYVKRHLEEQVHYSSNYYPAVMVCGQRQVGKSTMLHTIKSLSNNRTCADCAVRFFVSLPGIFAGRLTPVKKITGKMAENMQARCVWTIVG